MAAFYEQTVDIALGSIGAFENGSVGTLTRCVSTDRVVNATAKAPRSANLPRQTRTPRIVELLRTAQEWRRQLDAGEVTSQAEMARREGVTRARVTQILGLLRLAPSVLVRLSSLPAGVGRSAITEHALRPVLRIEDHLQQAQCVEAILAASSSLPGADPRCRAVETGLPPFP